MKQDHAMKNLRHQIWKESYTTQLGKHFKKFETRDNQFDKISSLCIHDLQHLTALFPEKKADTPNFDYSIMMGLSSPDPSVGEYTFKPYLVCKQEGRVIEHEFTEIQNKEVSLRSSEVPLIYLEWVRKNWLELNSETMGSVFEAKFIQKKTNAETPALRITKRLLGYHFTATTNVIFWKFLNKHRGTIKEIRFHLGVDKNKDTDDVYTFSPVFEIHVPKLSNDYLVELHANDIKARQVGDLHVLYFEYTSPCPSSCPGDTE